MTLLSEVENFFGTANLYEVLEVGREATNEQIKKAYRKVSLKIHPDRVPESDKEVATKKFQVLAQVHSVLSNEERRNLYDQHGIISNEENLEGEADWANYWRILFPKITESDIKNFMNSYIGSNDEEKDLIKIYNRYEGDLDKISQTHISFDEETTVDQLKKLIDDKKIVAYPKFTDEPESKKSKRKRRHNKEAKQAEKLEKELMKSSGKDVNSMDDLTALIKSRSKNNFDTMISNLEAKYATKGTKRKRSNR